MSELQRYDKVWREEDYVTIKDGEGPFVKFTDHLKEIAKLEKQIKRLRKRLIAKQKYEHEMLVQCGSTPAYIEEIRRKDEAALRED